MNRKSSLTVLIVLALLAGLFGAAMPVSAAAGDVVLTIPLVNNIAKGASGVVPIQITNNVNIRGYQVYVHFDPTRIQVNSVADGGYVTDCVPTNMPTIANGGIDNTTGTIRAANCNILGGEDKLPGSGTLLNLNVTVKSDAPDGRAMFTFPTAPATQTPKVYDHNATAVPQADIIQNLNWVQVGAAASLQVTSITFDPTSGNRLTTVHIVVRNTGAGAMDTAESYTFSVTAPGANLPTPTSFTVTGLGAAGSPTDTFTQDYALDLGTNNQATVTVTNPTWAAGGVSASYFSSISEIDTTNVDATFQTFIHLTTDANINFGDLTLGANSQTGSMNVNSNAQQWQVTAASTNAGQMAEWNGTTFVSTGHKLHDLLSLSQSKRTPVTLTGAAGTLIPDGRVENQAPDTGEDYTLTYAQQLHAYDAALNAPLSYHMVVTYTAAVTF